MKDNRPACLQDSLLYILRYIDPERTFTKMFVPEEYDVEFAIFRMLFQTDKIRFQSNIISFAKPHLSGGVTDKVFRAL